jgi:hypothetical protein
MDGNIFFPSITEERPHGQCCLRNWVKIRTMRDVPGSTPAGELAGQLEYPSPNSIWSRALEASGDEAKARSWMDTPRDIFGGRSPQDLVATGDAADQRRVLEVLLRIDYGVFS